MKKSKDYVRPKVELQIQNYDIAYDDIDRRIKTLIKEFGSREKLIKYIINES